MTQAIAWRKQPVNMKSKGSFRQNLLRYDTHGLCQEKSTMRKFESTGIAVADVLVPRSGSDYERWAVVACDQYTSQPEYWADVQDFVGKYPSTLKIIYPEVFLNESDASREARIRAIHDVMREYDESGLLESHEGLIYVERTVEGRTRRGLVACIDLEKYDYNRGSVTPVRATEGTILERIPPRVRIRSGAPLELPHILILVDDPNDTMIGPLETSKRTFKKLYDFDLMKQGGHLSGYLVDDNEMEKTVVDALNALSNPEDFQSKYGLEHDTPLLLFAVGDGNHSLATARAIWQKARDEGAGMDSPLRWALVEFENIHDPGIIFEPIHRVLFGLDKRREILTELAEMYAGKVRTIQVQGREKMMEMISTSDHQTHRIGFVDQNGCQMIEVEHPEASLPVGTLQSFLDRLINTDGANEIDYVHGDDVVEKLGSMPGNAGFLLPAMDKHDLFRSVILDGALPRKTFSMGEANEKRFYMECRRLA